MKSKQPKRNRINMHDIIAQPLGALPGAVDAILRRPEALDEIEVQSIFEEASFLLLRAEEALAARDVDAFCALIKLLSEGFAHDDASLEKGVEVFGTNDALLQTLQGIFHVVVRQHAFPLHSHAVVEIVQVVGSLCDGGRIKDACGALFMEDLARILDDMYHRNVEESRANFMLQRAAATSLINLVKGSRQNKQRITSWGFLGDCCALSVDVFFQLQCIELLFRLSHHNNSVVAQLWSFSRLHPRVVENLLQLQNDATLLPKMLDLLRVINEGREDVLSFPLTRADVARTTITGPTMSYFTENYLVVLVTSGSADNITIPYRSIRSVTLGKEGRVNFRLEEFPSKIEVLLSQADAGDIVALFMGVEQLTIFKESRIRSWILAALNAKKMRTQGSAPVSNANGVDEPHSSGDASGKNNFKRHRAESLQLTGNESHVLTAFQNAIKASDDTVGNLLEKMKRLVDSKAESRQQEAVAILGESLGDIQRMVDEGRVRTDNYRNAFRDGMEVNVQNIEQRLRDSQSRVAVVVQKLNLTLQELKVGNTAIHEQMACIEISLQQSLEESREEEARECRALKLEGEEVIGRLEALLDRQLMQQTKPVGTLSDLLRSSVSRRVL